MSLKQKPATQLLLQIETQSQCCVATLLPAKWVESCGTDTTADRDLIWCTALLRGRNGKERMALSNALPAHAEVAYYSPREDENPTAFCTVNDDTGDEEILEGTWCLTLRAQQAASLGKTIGVFFTQFMGLHGPMTENCFTHNQAQKFLTNKNLNPLNGNTWSTRFTMKVEYIGVTSEEVSEMLEALFSKFPFLGWSGRYAFDPRGEFNSRYACECTSLEASSKKWLHAQTMRRSAARPDNCSQHTPMPVQGQTPLLVPFGWKPDANNAYAPTRPMPTTPAGALLKQPVTPPALIPKQEDLPSTCKRQKISGDESHTLLQTIGSEEKVQHSLRGDVLALRDLWQPLPGDAASGSSEQPSRSACPPASEDLLSDEEQGSFTAALRMALAIVQQQYEEVKGMMVQAEQWTCLQLIQQSLHVMDQCVTANHAGADKDWRRSTAVCTVDLLCRNLSVSPLLHSCVVELQKWNGHAQSLQVVRNSLDAHWPEMKASLVAQERWEELQNLTSARSILASTLPDDCVILEEDRPSVLQALRVLQDVISAEDRPSVLQAIRILQGV
jgi:hypothetical protein